MAKKPAPAPKGKPASKTPPPPPAPRKKAPSKAPTIPGRTTAVKKPVDWKGLAKKGAQWTVAVLVLTLVFGIAAPYVTWIAKSAISSYKEAKVELAEAVAAPAPTKAEATPAVTPKADTTATNPPVKKADDVPAAAPVVPPVKVDIAITNTPTRVEVTVTNVVTTPVGVFIEARKPNGSYGHGEAKGYKGGYVFERGPFEGVIIVFAANVVNNKGETRREIVISPVKHRPAINMPPRYADDYHWVEVTDETAAVLGDYSVEHYKFPGRMHVLWPNVRPADVQPLPGSKEIPRQGGKKSKQKEVGEVEPSAEPPTK
jgi:hypothetical protein